MTFSFRKNGPGPWAVTLGLCLLLVAGGIYIDRVRQAQDAALAGAELGREQARQARAETPSPGTPLLVPELAEETETPPETAAPPDDGPAQTAPTVYGEDGQPRETVPAAAAVRTWLRPLDGELLRGQGYGFDPTTEDYRYHRGADLAAASGEAVLCAEAGTVQEAREDGFWGGLVTVDHGEGWVSVYRGLTPEVSPGQAVEAGAVLGRVRESIPGEAAQDSHVHVELLLEEESQDPAFWL